MNSYFSYELAKTLHLIGVFSWMAGLLYLPRIMVYCSQQEEGSASYDVLLKMQERLYRIIITPSMLLSLLLGIILSFKVHAWPELWFQIKFALIILLVFYQGYLKYHIKQFASNSNKRSARFFRILNEVPAVVLIFIAALVSFKFL